MSKVHVVGKYRVCFGKREHWLNMTKRGRLKDGDGINYTLEALLVAIG